MGAAHAVHTAAAHDDDAVLSRTGLGGGHGLGALVEVLIQRVAAVAGHNDVGREAGALAPLADEGHALGVRLLQIAGPGCDDLLLAVQGHVEDELDVDHPGRRHHVFVDGVVLQHAGVGIGAGDGFVAVVLVDGLLRADAGQDALAAARETGEEMGLDEALGHQQVTVHSQLVDVEIRPRGQHAQMDELCGIKGVVDGDLLVIHNGVAEHPTLLLLRGGAVQTGGDQDGDVGVRVALPDLIQQDRKGDLAGHGPGVVAGDQNDLVLSLGQLPQAGRADGVLQCVVDQFHFGLVGLVIVHFGGDDRFQVCLVHMEIQRGCVVGDGNGFHEMTSLADP